MRISGGEAKGIQLKTLPRRSIRPTTNLVRQAIFSILENTTDNWCRVLDLCAGSGALGIEALSRKAEWVDFVDNRRSCCDIIKQNLQKIKGLHQANIYCCNANKAVSFLDNSYGIVFIDPPYSDPYTNGLLTNLSKSKLLERNSAIILCHGNRFPLASNYDGLHLTNQRRYGDTYISIYRKED